MVGLASTSGSILERLLCHVVLPERLPAEEEESDPEIADALTERLLQASRIFRDSAPHEEFQQWDGLRRVILTSKEVNRDGRLSKGTLTQAFRELEPGGMIILHVREQNAGLLIGRPTREKFSVYFEAFEASPRSEDVLAAPDALQWDFPGASAVIPSTEFGKESFQESLSLFLQQSSSQALKEFAALTRKSGSDVVECRDTTDPAIITHMLMTLLESYGVRTNPPVLRKRVRDDVSWSSGAERPWRRCPDWLVLRVGLARYLCNTYDGEVGRLRYKFLMCLVLAGLLRDSVGVVSVELLHNLRAKLARRLAKLENHRKQCSAASFALYGFYFSAFGPLFHESLQMASGHIESEWVAIQRKTQQPVRPLPRRADNANFTLTLPTSAAYLESILYDPFRAGYRHFIQTQFDGSAANQASQAFGQLYCGLYEVEQEIEDGRFMCSIQHLSNESACAEISKKVESYLQKAGPAYDGMAEQRSVMILTILELWTMMDKYAIEAIPLLSRYHPGLSPDALDVLLLPRYTDMCRLQRIQAYLDDRIQNAEFQQRTILEDPSSGCFAELYYDAHDDSGEMRELHLHIEQHAEYMRQEKEEELAVLNEEFEEIEGEIAESSCIYYHDGTERIHDDRRCRRCYLFRRRRRMRIKVWEDPLPSDMTSCKAVVFELRCPAVFATYRSTTWRIHRDLGYPNVEASDESPTLLQNYTPLQQFMGEPLVPLSLASTTKSFQGTHYRNFERLPANVENVCKPCSLRVGYYDSSNRLWPGEQDGIPSFAHHCQWAIPPSSAMMVLKSSPNFAVDSNGPSSNQILASQMRCPSSLSALEFMAYQSLFAGKHRRWISILIELGSSNLNFSKEDTTAIIAQLAVQAGPVKGADPLRLIHGIFRDEAFCFRLLSQLRERLEMIAVNWRETHLMDLVITLLLRVATLAPRSTATKARNLLDEARRVSRHWIRQLREEIHQSKDPEASRTSSRYALWAALLCRRTFAGLVDEDCQVESMPPSAVQCFVEASIALQDNLLSDPETLPFSLKQALVRDFKMRFLLSGLVRKSIECNPGSLTSAIDTVWPQPAGSTPRTYSSPKYFSTPYNTQWVEFEVDGSAVERRQTVHYEMNEGHLLIDQKPLGRLPAEHRASIILEELFGRQSLLTYPSPLPGMTHTLVFTPNGHQVHMGLRNGLLFIRAYYRGNILEFIPRTKFQDDLPASLVENCVHWLNVQTGEMEIRQRSEIWISKPSNWIVDVRLRLARRGNSMLVDPYSPLFKRIAEVFHRFENLARLTVYQPEGGTLKVELRRLELTFRVKFKGLLYCEELNAEIDPDQDVGTWYGLDSKLVVRDPDNPRRRSILVPMGPLSWARNGCHVAISADKTGTYGIFTINDVLGRIDCQCESRLLFRKAQLHAFTSFVLPDPLTRRTGTEEALLCLKSSLCQPPMPLDPSHSSILHTLANLTPKRVYYPKDLKVMQQVLWDPGLTTNIQSDQFWPAIAAIFEKSSSLSRFSFTGTKNQGPERGGDDHLSSRSQRRRSAFWRPIDREPKQWRTPDISYEARDRSERMEQRAGVYEAVSLLRSWDARLIRRPDLISLLNGLPNIQGHGHDYRFNKPVLSDLLNLDLGLEWGSLVDFCLWSNEQSTHALSFLLGMMSFRQDADMNVIRVFIAFAVSGDLKAIEPPEHSSYSHFSRGEAPSTDFVLQLIEPFRTPFVRGKIGLFSTSVKTQQRLEKEELDHKQRSEHDANLLAEHLVQQWPCIEPTVDDALGGQLHFLDISQALEAIQPEWLRMFQNWELSEYITRVQQALDECCLGEEWLLPEFCPESPDILSGSSDRFAVPTFSELMLGKPCALGVESADRSTKEHPDLQQRRIDSPFSDLDVESNDAPHTPIPEVQELEDVVAGLVSSGSTVRQEYGKDLQRSLNALKINGKNSYRDSREIPLTGSSGSVSEVQRLVSARFDLLCKELQKRDTRAIWLTQGGLWPCISPITLLESLRSTSNVQLETAWKDAIIQYGLSITDLQKLLRVIHADLKNNQRGVEEERKNPGHENWSPTEYPDWLLLEIDANILIRPDQVDVALATISPSSGGNSVLQMNMGQGKTSCIMPMVAAVLADSKRLVRVIVPKALLLQTAQTLQSRLGNLLGREVRHVPFSRKTPTAIDTIKAFLNIHRDAMEGSGIIVALPEHVMSFYLSGIQRLSDGRHAEAVQLVKAQKWMRRVCRDVLDECDFTLAVRTQLIYPSGRQTSVDGNPNRWELPEALLKLVEGHLRNLNHKFPQSIEVVQRHEGSFPWIFFLRKDVEEALISCLVEDVIRGRLLSIPLRDSSVEILEAVKDFISKPLPESSAITKVDSLPHTTKKSIYQLRGLLVHRILLLTLKKRWNVQYGLHPSRDPIAVPYYAKGVPSDQSEWGHPDVAILFTCLSFYFGGLTVAQLRESLQSVLKSNDPSREYACWAESVVSLPNALREWNIINVDDEAQLAELWCHFRRSVVVIDYFLNHSVFPKHAKQFQTKIQASGWDIPAFEPQSTIPSKRAGGSHRALTTGFSGTNDNRTMLPLTIKQDDLPGLLHTNADVLTYLLQPRNRGYFQAADDLGKRVSELGLLKQLCSRSMRILIDAGAQILEMDNKMLVKNWMNVDTEAKAALYFRENKPYILYRKGTEVPLLASPFVDDLGECLVYLDEAHTRGTDLKMPPNARGALTLGLGQTKDHTVQAAMRLRQLASTQSVVFVATPEVHQSIVDHNHKVDGSRVDSRDVICWLLEQTCAGIEQLQPLYFSQGMDFCRRAQAAVDHPLYLSDQGQEAYLKEMHRDEKQTLEEMYQPRTQVKDPDKFKSSQSADIASFKAELKRRRKGFQDVGHAVHGSALQEVEQEREVTQEVEAVREVQKPFHVTPLKYGGLHQDIATFARTGMLDFGSPSFDNLSVVLSRTATGQKYRLVEEHLRTKVLVSREFMRTVELKHPDDRFLRTVNWLLWSKPTGIALVVTPEEAEDLIPLVRKGKSSSTHLLTYASPVTKKMLCFNSLRYHCIPKLHVTWCPPQWLMIELGLLAGRLYFKYEEYGSLAQYFGIPIEREREEGSAGERPTHAVTAEECPDSRAETAEDDPDCQETRSDPQQGDSHARACFRVQGSTAKTLEFLQEWLASRHRGHDFTNTPMGFFCHGKVLCADHPLFSSVASEDEPISGFVNLSMND